MANPSAVNSSLTFEEAQPFLQEAVNRVIGLLEGGGGQPITAEEYMRFYTIVYEVCSVDPVGLGTNAERLYDGYKQIFEHYISSRDLPCLRGKRNEELLQGLLERWRVHKMMTQWLSRFFHYLDRYHTWKHCLPSLVETSHLRFYELVYGEIDNHIRDAILSLIDREREGEQIDQNTVREVLHIYVEIGAGSVKYYIKDFEQAMMNATSAFYARKARDWIKNMPVEDYRLKIEQCLNQENTRIQDYLKFSGKEKLLEITQNELVTVLASNPEEKQSLISRMRLLKL